MAFEIIRAQLDRDREKYEKICKRNAENGKRGGRPPKEEKTQWDFEKPKKAYNNNNNDSDIVTDNNSGFRVERSFDLDDFFNAALARSYGEEKK